MEEFIFDLQRFNPAIVLHTLASVASGLENAEDGAEVAKFVGDLYDSTKSLIEDIGNRNITSSLFESLNVLTSIADFIASKLPIKELPFFRLASSMSALEAAIQNAQQQYDTESSVSQDNLDGIVTNLIDFCGETVKIISFFVPVPATVKLLADMPFIGVVDIATATLRTQYLTKTNGKSFGETFWGELWRGVDDIFVDIGDFIGGKINSASRSAGVIKIVYDDGSVKYYNETDNTQINLPDEDNRLSNQASGVTVKGGTGNDTVFTNENTERNSIDGGSGNDFIVAYDNDSTIAGGDDDDRIAIFGTQNKIYGDAGKDIILLENGADSNTVNGGLGDDIIVLESVENAVIEYNAGDGNDVIIGYAESDVIHITGDYSTSINGQDVIISVGDDSIILSGASGKEININGTKGLIGEESETPLIVTIPSVWDEGVNIIRGTSGNDTIVNSSYGKNVMIHAGKGNDEINNFASNVTINGDEGNDTITGGGYVSFSNPSRIGGGATRYYYYIGKNIDIHAGTGNDSINLSGIENAIIDVGEGDDIIYIGSYYSTVYRNTSYVPADHVTINGGQGNDSVQIYGENNLFIYNGDDGNDIIHGFNETSTLSISGGSYSSQISGSDIIVTVGDGSISLVGAATLDNLNIIGTLAETDDTADDSLDDTADDSLDDTADDSLDDTADDSLDDTEDDSADDTEDDSTDDTEDDSADDTEDDSTDDTADDSTDDTADDDILIDNKLKEPEFILKDDKKFVDASKRTKAIQITGNALANLIVGGRGNDTLDSAGGDDTLTGGKGSDLFIFSGGKNIITDYEKKDKIITGDGLSYTGFAVDGSDLIFNFGENNSLTIQDGAGKKINMNSTVNFYTADGILDKNKKSITLASDVENFTASSNLKTINGSETGAIEILGNSKANSIVAGASGSTLTGGKGRDTLHGGDGADVFIYANKSGKDVIENYGAGDRISLGSDVTIKDVKIKKDNVVMKFKGGSLTVNDTTTFTLTDDGNETIFSGGVFLAGDSVKVIGNYKGTVDLTEGFKNVDASLAKKKLTINGSDADNYLVGGKGKDCLTGGAGNDSIWGGKKNDTLAGGDGDDTFIFQAGGGNDTILDYASGELLQILDKRGDEGTFKNSTFKGDTLTLAIQGGGKVILSGVETSTDFNINGEDYHVEGNTLAK